MMSGVLASHGWLFLGASEGLVTDIPALAPLARHGRIGYRHAVLPSSVGAPALPPPRITVPTLVELPPESAAPPADVADDRNRATDHLRDQREALEQAANKVLSPRQRRIVELSADGWAVPEIATELRTTPERVSDEKYKAIRKLRSHFGIEA